ncbi:MAG TPA: DUF1800 domain-containing protein [Phycisphaerales bacterium]|nr:DUF1800 domain-containing protein [Phycisphaerales bacterium]
MKSRVDHKADLSAFRPGEDGAWDLSAASHLLTRAGFAPSAAELARAVGEGPGTTVDRLVDGEEEASRAAELEQIRKAVARADNIDLVRGWWLKRMVRTSRPLHARMSVFWHNHFATSNEKVMSPPLMMKQLDAIERNGLGRFEMLVGAMSRDPAMIIWLDGDSNIKGRPNENYARELFELFTLGVGNYTERDIKESARAFTGWHQRQGEFRFFERDHDAGEKTVLGTTGTLGGDDVIGLAVNHPACARFLAVKLLGEFVTSRPEPGLIESFAGCLREHSLDMGRSLKVLLASRAMFAPEHRMIRIKSPVEFVVGACRSLETRAPARPLIDSVGQMGQRLLEPPSVKGWNGHRAWINSSTMLLRLSAVHRLTEPDGAGMLKSEELCASHGLDSPEKVIEFAVNITHGGTIPAGARESLATLTGKSDHVLRNALRILMCMPEYQLA